MRVCHTVYPFLLAAAFSFAAAAPPGPASLPIVPFDEVHGGMTGTGHTVFEGHRIDSFGVEILGTVEQGATQPRMIICRLSGKKIEKTGVLAAMSGSPVVVKGRFLGAVAFSWPYTKEPLCGLTPAEDLLAVRSSTETTATVQGGRSTLTLSDFPWRIRPATENKGEVEPAGLEHLASMGFAWSVGKGAPPPPSASPSSYPPPGGMIGVQLVAGDVQFTAFGTVSWVDGDQFVAFGHPFLNLGPLEMPVVSARVVTPVPSVQRGFKLCAPEKEIGTVLVDGRTGVYGRFGRSPSLLPVDLTLRRPGRPERTYRFSVALHPQLTPFLVNGSLAALWGALGSQASAKTADLESLTLELAGGKRVAMKPQTFSGQDALSSLDAYVSGAVDLLLNNPREPLLVRRISLSVIASPGRRFLAVERAWLDRPAVAAGDPLTLHVRLREYQGPPRVLTVAIPTRGLPVSKMTVTVGGALDMLKDLTEARSGKPASGEGYLRYLDGIPSNRSLLAAVFLPEPGVLLQDRRVGSLPPSVAAVVTAQPSAAREPLKASRLLLTKSVPAGEAVKGIVSLSFRIKESADEDR